MFVSDKNIVCTIELFQQYILSLCVLRELIYVLTRRRIQATFASRIPGEDSSGLAPDYKGLPAPLRHTVPVRGVLSRYQVIALEVVAMAPVEMECPKATCNLEVDVAKYKTPEMETQVLAM